MMTTKRTVFALKGQLTRLIKDESAVGVIEVVLILVEIYT